MRLSFLGQSPFTYFITDEVTDYPWLPTTAHGSHNIRIRGMLLVWVTWFQQLIRITDLICNKNAHIYYNTQIFAIFETKQKQSCSSKCKGNEKHPCNCNDDGTGKGWRNPSFIPYMILLTRQLTRWEYQIWMHFCF